MKTIKTQINTSGAVLLRKNKCSTFLYSFIDYNFYEKESIFIVAHVFPASSNIIQYKTIYTCDNKKTILIVKNNQIYVVSPVNKKAKSILI